MLNSLDLNNAVEKSTIHILTTQASARLSHSDAKLPQVLAVCEMVKRGIGVVSLNLSYHFHHLVSHLILFSSLASFRYGQFSIVFVKFKNSFRA